MKIRSHQDVVDLVDAHSKAYAPGPDLEVIDQLASDLLERNPTAPSHQDLQIYKMALVLFLSEIRYQEALRKYAI